MKRSFSGFQWQNIFQYFSPHNYLNHKKCFSFIFLSSSPPNNVLHAAFPSSLRCSTLRVSHSHSSNRGKSRNFSFFFRAMQYCMHDTHFHAIHTRQCFLIKSGRLDTSSFQFMYVQGRYLSFVRRRSSHSIEFGFACRGGHVANTVIPVLY